MWYMQTPIPSWLDNVTLARDPTLPLPRSPELCAIDREHEHATYNLIKQEVLDQIAGGAILGQIVKDYNDSHSQPISASRLRTWLMKSENAVEFDAALTLGTLAMMDEYIMIADAKDEPMVDVEHIKIRLKARDKHMGAFNKKLFGNDPNATNNAPASISVNITQVENPYLPAPAPTPAITTIDV
jgi:hypothetical protein